MVFTEEERKQRKKESNARYRAKNKEKAKNYGQEYYKKNKEKKNAQSCRWNTENKEKRKEIVAKNQKKFPHIVFKCKWKHRGIIWKDDDEFMEIWDKYSKATHCQNCNVEFKTDSTKMLIKCLDHCHESGKFRQIICNHCNLHIFGGK